MQMRHDCSFEADRAWRCINVWGCYGCTYLRLLARGSDLALPNSPSGKLSPQPNVSLAEILEDSARLVIVLSSCVIS